MTDGRFAAGWILRVAAGEATGFAVAAGVAIIMIVLAAPPALAAPVTVAGGAAEGALLALAQYSAMRAHRPPAGAWIAATAGAAALAWTLGMLPSTIGLAPSAWWQWALVGLGALVLLVSIPVAQALVLRRRGAVRWALANAAAWAVGVLWTAAPSPFIDERSPVALVAALYVVAGLLMALTVALLTAPIAARLFAGTDHARHRESRERSQPDPVDLRAAP